MARHHALHFQGASGLMATEDDVRAIALSLPGTAEEQWYQTSGYKVAGKGVPAAAD